ncbi:gliding motility-associated C-terminal domain-containing protein [Taibaiella chishuiensis]|uniref:Gliding motility-associated-like protein n=1 Tax=Taibaiella chishuiensis TaxID=1434707 RepID=A0A2P8CVQ1_9BACT|nr:gliding motility-associated C-terminal domain-containing protein [Taibaiella chishuiensis]PSK89054.1 gliding motility-associated-like protein [Taibaiella chishuiensis]
MKKILLLFLLPFISGSSFGQVCSGVWGPPIVNQTFGQGNATDSWYGPLATFAPGATTSTTFVGPPGPPGGNLTDGSSALTKTPSVYGANWINHADHTGNPFGLMFLVNAPSTAATIFFEYTMDNLCPNTTLRLSAWILNVNASSVLTSTCAGNYQYPNMTLRVIDPVTNAVLATTPTGNVPADSTWHQYSMVFSNGTNASVKLQLINNSVGSGCGNDLALDDITVQPCVPVSHVLPKIDTLICQNTSLTFNAQVVASPYNPAEYQWQYSTDAGATWVNQGAASNSTAYVFNATTASPGTYWIRYRTGPQGTTANVNCIATSDTTKVTVSAPPVLPVLNYTSKYCTGTPFEGFTIVSGTNLKWYTSSSGGTGSTATPVVNTAIPGVYTWYVSQTTAQGCESNRLAVTITVVQLPASSFTPVLGLACAQDTVHFQNTSTNGNTYFWDFGDGHTDTAKNPVHIYPNQGSYSVMLASYNSYCADTLFVTVNITHPLQALFTTSADTICEGGTIAFTNTSTVTTVNGIAPTYHWNFGDGSAVSTQQSPSHTFPAPGIYTVSLVTGNSIPCFDTMRRTVYVDSLPYVSFTRSDTAICMGDNIVFNATYGSSGLKELLWNFGDKPDLIADVNPATYSYDAPGVYTVTLNGKYRVCDEVSTTAKVTVKPMPTINIGSDTSICLDGTPFIIGDQLNAGNPLASWDWSTGDTTAAITIRHYGHYKARVTIDQCSTTDEIEVRKDCFIDMPNSFTPNGDGINDYFFPRQLLSAGLKSFKMAVFDRWGQKVFETESINGRGWDGKFNGKEQPLGVYIYQIDVVMKNERTETYTGNVTLLK